MNFDDAVVLKKFFNMEEANLAASVLRDSGIECEVHSDDAGGAYPMLHLAVGIRLIVDRRAEEAARGVLNRMTDISDEELNRQAEEAGKETEEEEES